MDWHKEAADTQGLYWGQISCSIRSEHFRSLTLSSIVVYVCVLASVCCDLPCDLMPCLSVCKWEDYRSFHSFIGDLWTPLQTPKPIAEETGVETPAITPLTSTNRTSFTANNDNQLWQLARKIKEVLGIELPHSYLVFYAVCHASGVPVPGSGVGHSVLLLLQGPHQTTGVGVWVCECVCMCGEVGCACVHFGIRMYRCV